MPATNTLWQLWAAKPLTDTCATAHTLRRRESGRHDAVDSHRHPHCHRKCVWPTCRAPFDTAHAHTDARNTIFRHKNAVTHERTDALKQAHAHAHTSTHTGHAHGRTITFAIDSSIGSTPTAARGGSCTDLILPTTSVIAAAAYYIPSDTSGTRSSSSRSFNAAASHCSPVHSASEIAGAQSDACRATTSGIVRRVHAFLVLCILEGIHTAEANLVR